MSLQAPSLRAGRVTVGELVTVTIRATDDRGIRPDSVTLRVNGEPQQVTSVGTGTDFTATLAANAVDTLYSVVATARDATGNEGVAQAAFQAISGTPPPALPGPPRVLTGGIFPPDGATEINVFTEIDVPFSEGIANLDATTVVLDALDPAALAQGVQRVVGGPVAAEMLLGGTAASASVTLRPQQNLQFGTPYRVTLKGSLVDQDGEALGQDVTSVFTTKPLTPVASVGGSIRGVVLVDQYAILLDRTAGVKVVDVSDATRPVERGAPVRPFGLTGGPSAYQGLAAVRDFSYEVPGQGTRTQDLAVVVGYRWIADEGAQGVLGVVDITTRTAPVRLGEAVLTDRTFGLPMRVVMKGPYALVSSASQGVLVVDVAHALAVIANRDAFPPSAQGSLVGLFDADGALHVPISLVPYQQDVLVGDVSAGLYRLDLSALPAVTGERLLATRVFRLQVVEAFPVVDPATGNAILTDLALISNSQGLTVFDLGARAVLGTVPLPAGTPFDVTVERDRGLVFVASGGGGLTVLDLRQPAAPVVVGTREGLGFANGPVAIDREYAYVAGAGGLQIVKYDPPGLEIYLRGTSVAETLPGPNGQRQRLEGILLIKNQYTRDGQPLDPPVPTMPTILLKAQLPTGEAWRKPYIETVRWELVLDYSIGIPVIGRNRGVNIFRQNPLTGVTEKDGLRLTFESNLDQEVPIPWPSGFLGGGELEITATPILASSHRPDRSLDAQVIVTTGFTERAFLNGLPYSPTLSPGSSRPRIEGELMYPLTAEEPNPSGLPVDGSVGGNTNAKEGSAVVDPGFRAAVLAYLQAPVGEIETTAQTVLQEVRQPLFFQVVAYQERVRGAPYAQFHKLQFNSLTGKTGQPAEAAYPTLNALGRGPTLSTDGGFGVMQLTNPPPLYSQIWHWQKNIDSAIRRLSGHLDAERTWLATHTDSALSNVDTRGYYNRMGTYARYNGLGYPGLDTPQARRRIEPVRLPDGGRIYPFWRWDDSLNRWIPRVKRDEAIDKGINYAYEARDIESNAPPDFN